MAIYTQPSITGYNASPPPDDGSSTSANELTWAKHKDKLADPIKTYAEAVDANVLAAFDRIPFIKTFYKTANYTLVNTDRGSLISITNTVTITLLPAATAGDGWSTALMNAGGGTVTIDGDSSETINGSATHVMVSGEWVILQSDGSNWNALAFTGALPTSEGAWVPAIQDASFSDAEGQTYFTQIGSYLKIGTRVHFQGTLSITSLGTLTAGGNAYISGLPFTSVNSLDLGSMYLGHGTNLNIAAGQIFSGQVVQNGAVISLHLWDQAAGVSDLLISDISDDGQFSFAGQYLTA